MCSGARVRVTMVLPAFSLLSRALVRVMTGEEDGGGAGARMRPQSRFLGWYRGGVCAPDSIYSEVEGSFLTRRWARKELSMGLSSGVGWELFRAEYVAAMAPLTREGSW